MSKAIYSPMGSRVVVKEENVVEKTEGGIIATEIKAFTTFIKAKVKAVGDEVKKFKEGDDVLIESGSGAPLMMGNEECKVLFEPDVAFVVTYEDEK